MSDAAALLDETGPAPELPRLTIIHLMAWTATAAIALCPYLLAKEALGEAADDEAWWQSTMDAAMPVVYSIMAGASILVGVLALRWKLKGRLRRLAPGHWIAWEAIVYWSVHVLSSLAAFSLNEDTFASAWFMGVPGLLLSSAFLAAFLWLAVKTIEPMRWRIVYATFALAGIGEWLAANAWYYAGTVESYRAFLIAIGICGAMVTAALIIGLVGDIRGRCPRHWTHWLSVGTRTVGSAAYASLYLVCAVVADWLYANAAA